MRLLQIDALILADGSRIALHPNGITVIVGPNNSGKSAALKMLRWHLRGAGSGTIEVGSIVTGIDLSKTASVEQVRQMMARNIVGGQYSTPEGSFQEQDLGYYWSNPGLGPLAAMMTTYLMTENRLGDCQPCQNIDAVNSPPNHPFQRMMADRTLENRASEAVRRAFGADLVIDRGAGGVIPAYIGKRPTLQEAEERGDASYSSRVRALAPLQEQGDGLRSFVSIIARTLTEEREILLIDEPEAFLHPPQARLVGRLIAEQNADRQTFIATHSSDVLQGLLSDPQHASAVTVVRLSRDGAGAAATILNSEKLAALWNDPILRFSNILDGLFHHGVVVTESDADCRFYEAMAEVVAPTPRPDLHYCYSGGKDRLHIVIRALTALGLPLAAVVDFDVLNDETTLRRILEAAGGSWADVVTDWAVVKATVETKSSFLGAREYAREVTEQLKLCASKDTVPRDVLSKIRKLSRAASPWDFCKTAGLSALQGAAHGAATRLLQTLRRQGIFIVPVGEMEGFARSIEPKGARWVEQVMKQDFASNDELATARAFCIEVAKFFTSDSSIVRA